MSQDPRLEELISIVQFVDRHRLGPTWRLLDEHQLRDESGRVVGYRALVAGEALQRSGDITVVEFFDYRCGYCKRAASALTELVVCDTIPLKQASPKIKVLSVAGLFAKAIRNAHEYKSINSLFVPKK